MIAVLVSPIAAGQTPSQSSGLSPAAIAAGDADIQSDASAELIKKLEKALTNTKWTGKFTRVGNDKPPQSESYRIQKAQYKGGNDWLLTAQISYGKNDITVPIPLQIRWADRTPVITVDALTIPTLGTFDARVLIRRGSYAGTWAHGKKGGHLFGRYEKAKPSNMKPSSTEQ